MRKYTLCLAVLSLCLLLTGCGQTVSAPKETEAPKDNSWTQKVRQEPTEAVPEDEPWVVMPELNPEGTIEPTVLLEEGGIKITAQELTYNRYSAELSVLVENQSQKNLSVISGSLGYSRNSVNGQMIYDGYMHCELAPGETSEEDISFSNEMLLFYGIREIADLELGFYTTDDDYHSTYFKPCQLKTALYEAHDYEQNVFQEAIVEKTSQQLFSYQLDYFEDAPDYQLNELQLLSWGLLHKDQEPLLFLEFFNGSQIPVEVNLTDPTINGLVLNSTSQESEYISPGKTAVLAVPIPSDFRQIYQSLFAIDQIGAAACTLTLENEDGRELLKPQRLYLDIPDVPESFQHTGTEVFTKNDLRILSLDVLEDPSEYSDEMHLLFLVENQAGLDVKLNDQYDSAVINGQEADYSLPSLRISNGESGILDLTLYGSWLKDNQISQPSHITQAELGLKISSGSTTLEEPTLKITY